MTYYQNVTLRKSDKTPLVLFRDNQKRINPDDVLLVQLARRKNVCKAHVSIHGLSYTVVRPELLRKQFELIEQTTNLTSRQFHSLQEIVVEKLASLEGRELDRDFSEKRADKGYCLIDVYKNALPLAVVPRIEGRLQLDQGNLLFLALDRGRTLGNAKIGLLGQNFSFFRGPLLLEDYDENRHRISRDEYDQLISVYDSKLQFLEGRQLDNKQKGAA